MIRFRQKLYSSFIDYGIKGALFGASLGGLAVNAKKVLRSKHKNADDPNLEYLNHIGKGAAIGAVLGAIVGGIRDIQEIYSRAKTGQHRILVDLRKSLKKNGLVEEKDFTIDPKRADRMKIPVCMVINKSNGDLKISLNLSASKGLDSVSKEILKGLPKLAKSEEKTGDRFNEIKIVTVSNRKDIQYLTSVVSAFCSAGYPVYLLEIG